MSDVEIVTWRLQNFVNFNRQQTKSSVLQRIPRPSLKHRYRPQRVDLRLRELRREPKSVPPRVVYVQNPYYEKMECGSKMVEVRPNYPCLRDLVPGTRDTCGILKSVFRKIVPCYDHQQTCSS